uniref:Uncharacterized protein n=1 Tax=Alexandrium andersonii TaxID=327968 RepID=A0A7S2MUE1_9DINO|mmetsp:Transcript_76241/g.170540  ORF Transcript_76241/g.170540 Transcript_76241/m.170540 type:complete len:513 (+) Transcript_76241:106-1644(+)
MTNTSQLCDGGPPSRARLGGATRRIFVLIVARSLSVVADDIDDASGGWQDNSAQLGLLRSSLRGAAATRGLFAQEGELAFRTPGIVVPQPNDTISEEYWAQVNRAINRAGMQTSPPPSANDPMSTPTPEPWKKIFQASDSVNVLNARQADNALSSWEYATPQPWSETAELTDRAAKSVGVVPYDMQIGARIMYGLSSKNTGTPPPTQAFVDESFMAQCPMIMFTGALEIKPPRCNEIYGSWSDPATGRNILRWDDRKGGLFFGVDSIVTGQGSVKFAEFKEQFSLNENHFQLLNCMEVMRYKVQEKVIKVNHMAPMASSTIREHDISKSGQAFFYKYVISHTNGTAVGETTLFRMDQNEVNFTMYKGELSTGQVFATARRQGFWRQDQWRDCRHKKRSWVLEFPMANANFATIATVQDLRVAATATITLMAYRDEQMGADGFTHVGQGHLYFTLVKAFLYVLLAGILACTFWIVIVQVKLDKRLQWICFRLETVLLPKRPVHQRNPVLHPVY